jgi:mono/diheme cytochrome c family protein
MRSRDTLVIKQGERLLLKGVLRICHAAIFIGAVGLTGSEVIAADMDHGADLAKRWCATCHVVDSDQRQASADVPPFAAIARKPDLSPEKLAFFLLDPHPKMPNFPLNRAEAADIAAYIASLRK